MGLGFSPIFFIGGPNTLLSFSIVQSFILLLSFSIVQYFTFFFCSAILCASHFGGSYPWDKTCQGVLVGMGDLEKIP